MIPFNWVDVFLLFYIVLIIKDGEKSDVVTEVLKLIGILLGTFISLHYYVVLGHFIQGTIFVPAGMEQLYGYGILLAGIVLLIPFIRRGWLVLLNVELPVKIEKTGRILLSFIRAVLLCGLIFVALLLSNRASIIQGARESFSARLIGRLSFNIYKVMMAGITKIIPMEKANEEIFSLYDTDSQPKQVK